MLKAVIFDLDGVLLDNTQLIVEIFQEAARRSSAKVPDGKSVIATLGLIEEKMIQRLLGKGEKYKKILHRVWTEKEDEEMPMSGIKKVLNGLKIKKAVVTSAPKAYTERRLKDFINYFDVIITRELTDQHKPNSEPLLLACKKLNIRTKEAVYVGDRIIDFETAKNAGTDFIGILSGGTSKKEFEKVGVKKTISSLADLLKVL
jgi:HAD superfamily hydrolase (TIGR01549 family)